VKYCCEVVSATVWTDSFFFIRWSAAWATGRAVSPISPRVAPAWPSRQVALSLYSFSQCAFDLLKSWKRYGRVYENLRTLNKKIYVIL
jgi:hypothetical protein